MNSKRILAPFLAAASALCLTAIPLSADTFGKFTYTDNGTSITIIGYPDAETGAVVIPGTIVSKPVTSIGDNAFYQCTGLTSVTIPKSVTSIGKMAFYLCEGLTSVSIPNSVTSIREKVFFGCTGLTSVSIGSGVKSIGNYAFDYCSGLTSVSIPNSVTSIEASAFNACTKLEAITVGTLNSAYASTTGVLFNKNKTNLILFPEGKTGSYSIPNSVTYIGTDAFNGCTGLTSVSIPNSVTSIAEKAFIGCSHLTRADFLGNAPLMGWAVFRNTASGFTVYYQPGSTDFTTPTWNTYPCVEDSSGQFTYTDNGTSITITGYPRDAVGAVVIPSTISGKPVKSIGKNAFKDCSGLTSVSIPNSVTSIGNRAFILCTGLTSVSIPNSVTSIGNEAFYGCSGLTSVSIPNSVAEIRDWAFSGCSGLTSVSIPNSVTSIGWGAFDSCTGLTSVSIPDSVTSIGDYAFSFCTGLTSVSIPNSVTEIGVEAFNGCKVLTRADFLGNAPTMVANVFANAASDFTVYYQPGSTGFKTPNWKGYPCSVNNTSGQLAYINNGTSITITGCPRDAVGAVVIPGTISGKLVTSIGIQAFKDCTGLTSVSIPNSVTSIGDSAFRSCTGLTSVSIPNSVTSIGNEAFWGCTGLTSVSIGSGVTSIGVGAFVNCTGLISVSIGSGVTSIGDNAFYQCTGLTSVTIPKSVTSIAASAFRSCTGLTSVSIPKSVTSIGDYAFYLCSGLTRADFLGNAPVMGSDVFKFAASGFTVYYQPGSTGFATPTWKTYPCVEDGTSGKFTYTDNGTSITSNDANENPYDITLKGTGLAPAPTLADAFLATAGTQNGDTWKIITTIDPKSGLKYRAIVVTKAPGTAQLRRIVQVSSNLIDWYSGKNHTTVITDDAALLKVRDNTPLILGTKRYIRLKTIRE